MTKYKVTGKTPLKGKVKLHGAKNAGFKAMIAALLADSPSTLTNVGLISEIGFAKEIITSLGASVEDQTDPHSFTIDPKGLTNHEIPSEFGNKSRASMIYAGPLLAKFGRAVIPTPGGDIAIGKRPINRHLDGLQAMGAQINIDTPGVYTMVAPNGLAGCKYKFEKITHTGTETLVLAAVKAKGSTTLENCAQDPEIDNLIEFLTKMGAKVNRTLPTTIEIEGTDHLSGALHKIIPDRIEAATFACMALGTKGEIEVLGANPSILHSLLYKVEEIGGEFEIRNNSIIFRHARPLSATNLTVAPYPGFLTDWQPLWTTLMTQANGVSIVHETIFESRFGYVDNLLKMGARIELFNPVVNNPDFIYQFNFSDDNGENKHAAKVFGPTNLIGTSLEIVEIRGGATALLAGMIADGETTILDSKDQIIRGYEDLPDRLSTLGAIISVS